MQVFETLLLHDLLRIKTSEVVSSFVVIRTDVRSVHPDCMGSFDRGQNLE